MSVRDIDMFWGSHSTVMEPLLASLKPGSLVIEHGAGLFSSTLISRYDVRVVVIEEMQGWIGWAKWLYSSAGREVSVLDRAKPVIPLLAESSLVFIDGATRERGDVLKWSLDAKAPIVVAHDTEEDHRKQYGYHSNLFERPGYSVSHDGVFPRTTTWSRR